MIFLFSSFASWLENVVCVISILVIIGFSFVTFCRLMFGKFPCILKKICILKLFYAGFYMYIYIRSTLLYMEVIHEKKNHPFKL